MRVDGVAGLGLGAFAQRVAVAVAVAAAILIALAVLWRGIHVLLLVAAGILVAVFLETVSSAIARKLEIDYGPSLALTLLGLVVLAGGIGWWVAPQISAQFDQLVETIPKALEDVQGYIRRSGWGRQLLREVPQSVEELPVGQGEVVSRITGLFSTTFGVFTDVIVLLFVGLFLAAQPELYRRGLLKLLPPGNRAHGGEVMDHLHAKLRRWLFGQFVSMAIVGTLTTIGLWALGIPLALALGLLAALFEFIPNLGPLLASLPAILLGLTISPQQALFVILLYLAVQTLESQLIYPVVQRKAAELPPALTISVQLLAGVVLGAIGFVLATPLLVIAMGLVEKIYIEGPPEESGGQTG